METTKTSDAIREFIKSDKFKSILLHFDTKIREEVFFDSISHGKPESPEFSELQKAAKWHDKLLEFASMLDPKNSVEKLIIEFVEKAADHAKQSAIRGHDLYDAKVYSSRDWEKISLAMDREVIKYPEALATSLDKNEIKEDNPNPYEKA